MKSTLIVLALLGVPALAQKPAPQVKAALPAPVTTTQLPAPTELEAAQLENLELKRMMLEQEAASIPQRREALNEQYGALIRKIQAEHPGYFWNPQAHSLLPAPTPVAPAAPAPKKDESPKR